MGIYTQQLALVRDAIAKVVSGAQAVSYGDREVTRADLGKLHELEKDYAARAAAEARAAKGRSRITYVVPN